MHDDDLPVGRLLSRREIVALFGAAGASLVAARAAAATGRPTRAGSPTPRELPRAAGATGAAPRASRLPTCVARPQQTEGPYFVDTKLDRSDIRSDPASGAASAGAPLALAFHVSKVGPASCEPLSGAMVDVWQCDAGGIYSDVRDMGGAFDARGKKFLRGFQRTGSDGIARFTTIYPGWYEGRAVHIHFKVRTPGAGGRTLEFTSQVYFDDALSDEVFATAPYDAKPNARRVRNDRDGIFRNGGRQLMLDVKRVGDGFAATFDLGLAL